MNRFISLRHSRAIKPRTAENLHSHSGSLPAFLQQEPGYSFGSWIITAAHQKISAAGTGRFDAAGTLRAEFAEKYSQIKCINSECNQAGAVYPSNMRAQGANVFIFS